MVLIEKAEDFQNHSKIIVKLHFDSENLSFWSEQPTFRSFDLPLQRFFLTPTFCQAFSTVRLYSPYG